MKAWLKSGLISAMIGLILFIPSYIFKSGTIIIPTYACMALFFWLGEGAIFCPILFFENLIILFISYIFIFFILGILIRSIIIEIIYIKQKINIYLQGGIAGFIVWIVMFLILIITGKLLCVGRAGENIMCYSYLILSLVSFVLIGTIIGWIIGKINTQSINQNNI